MSLLDIDSTNKITEDGLKSLGFIKSHFLSYWIRPVFDNERLANFYYNTDSQSVNIVSDNPYLHPSIKTIKTEIVEDILDLSVYINKAEEEIKKSFSKNNIYTQYL